MKLVGELKEKVEKAESMDEAKQAIENAGIELTENELNSVAGGITQQEADAELEWIRRSKEEYYRNKRTK